MKIKNHCKVDIKGLEMEKALEILKKLCLVVTYINGTYVQDTEMEAITKACEWIMEQAK